MVNKLIECSFGKVSRNMIENIQREHEDFKSYITKEFADLKNTNIHLYNHLSRRLPSWATVLIAILTAVIGALIGRGVL